MSSNIITQTIMIEGMTCVNCENRIERKLASTVGIENVKVSYTKGNAVVTFDPQLISQEELEKIIEELDYHVRRLEQNEEKKIDITNLISVAAIIITFLMLMNRFGGFNIINAFPVAKEGMGYGMLFIIGLLTSVHCVAMCGGLSLTQCVSKNMEAGNKEKRFNFSPSIMYNSGRVISYTVVGGIVGALGSVVSFSGPMKGIVQLLAGIFMVIMGVNMLNLVPWLRKFNPRMPKLLANKVSLGKRSKRPFYIGLLNGLMPCGPLQAMQLYALSTGNPIEGALSMFLFSIGTVPLMFTFGALSTLISKKFTGKMMSVSAVLVIILGVFMFGSGASLSGITVPTATSSSANNNIATIEEGIQTVTTTLASGRYEPITVQKGIPVKWVIQAEESSINGCNNSIIIPKYNLQYGLEPGDNVIEFTPEESGTIPFSCWMGMIRSKITVVDDLTGIENSVTTDNSVNTDNSNSNGNDDSTGSEPYIPTDEIAVAEVGDGVQYVEITLEDSGFSPAVVVIQKDIETKWNINSKIANSNNILFPLYYAQIAVLEGDNNITLIPDQDFDFLTEDGSFYGYVKVVEDINEIDMEAIKREVEEYDPTIQEFDDDTGLPSCH